MSGPAAAQTHAAGDDEAPLEVIYAPAKLDAPFIQVEMKGLRDAGVTLHVITPPGVPLRRSWTDFVKFARDVRRARKAHPRAVLHANQGLCGLSALLGGHRPDVLTIWGSELFFPYQRPIMKAVARLSRQVLTMSRENAAILGPRVKVIPRGTDLSAFSPRDRDEARRRLGWTPDEKVVLFAYDPGRPEKRFDLARRVVDACGVPGARIHVLQGVPHAQMADYYSAADAFLLTSDHEGLPNAVKEAMACNLPVVSRPVGDMAHVLQGVTPGGVAETPDALAALLRDALLAGKRSDGRARAHELFDLPTQTRRLIAVYRDVQRARRRR